MKLKLASALICLLLLIPSISLAQAAKEFPKITPSATFLAGLDAMLNTKVTLYLRSGVELSGNIKSVGTDSLHLSGIQGKEFFDALIRKEDIQAVVFQARNN